jgi:hypothetical protein
LKGCADCAIPARELVICFSDQKNEKDETSSDVTRVVVADRSWLAIIARVIQVVVRAAAIMKFCFATKKIRVRGLDPGLNITKYRRRIGKG